MEHRVRFELTVLRVCNPSPWTARAPVHCLVAGPGIEPGTRAYETRVLPLHYPAIIVMGGFGRWHHDSPAGFIERIASNQFSLPLKERTCPLLLILAVPRRVELLHLPWQGNVLTDILWDQKIILKHTKGTIVTLCLLITPSAISCYSHYFLHSPPPFQGVLPLQKGPCFIDYKIA